MSGLRFATRLSTRLLGLVPDSWADCAAVGAGSAVAVAATVPGSDG